MTQQDIIDALNGDIVNEYQHMLFYMHAASVLSGLERLYLGEFFRKQAESEMGHVLQFAHKIRALGGVPAGARSYDWSTLGNTAKSLLTYAANMEEEVVANYHRRLKQFEALEEKTGKFHDLVMFVEEQIEDSQNDLDEMYQLLRGMA
jgi:bacterioferritin (cytochrome b1)